MAAKRAFVNRPKRRRMHRHACGRQVVIPDRIHSHHREHPANREELVGSAEADSAVALDAQTLQFAIADEAIAQIQIVGEGVGIHVTDQFGERAVLRDLGPEHIRHGA